MAVTLSLTPADYSVLAQWTSTIESPTYYVYVNGLLVATTTGTSYVVPVESGESVFIEVFDTASHTPTVVPQGRATLCWYAEPDALAYRIEEKIDGNWIERIRLTSTSWFLQWASRYLEDCQQHEWRITPIAQGETLGEPVEFWRFIARYPDPPRVVMTYSSTTGKLTIAGVA